jgi:hypothetical protein
MPVDGHLSQYDTAPLPVDGTGVVELLQDDTMQATLQQLLGGGWAQVLDLDGSTMTGVTVGWQAKSTLVDPIFGFDFETPTVTSNGTEFVAHGNSGGLAAVMIKPDPLVRLTGPWLMEVELLLPVGSNGMRAGLGVGFPAPNDPPYDEIHSHGLVTGVVESNITFEGSNPIISTPATVVAVLGPGGFQFPDVVFARGEWVHLRLLNWEMVTTWLKGELISAERVGYNTGLSVVNQPAERRMDVPMLWATTPPTGHADWGPHLRNWKVWSFDPQVPS